METLIFLAYSHPQQRYMQKLSKIYFSGFSIIIAFLRFLISIFLFIPHFHPKMTNYAPPQKFHCIGPDDLYAAPFRYPDDAPQPC